MKKTLNWLFDYPNLQVYQYEEAFKFSLDSILLAEFANIKKDDVNIIDLCSGNAVIPIVLTYKYQKEIWGIELQREIFELAQDSIRINGMEERIHMLHDSVCNVENYFPGNNFDVVLCNPPYFKYIDSSHVNLNEMKKIARHEVMISLEEIIKEASFLLKAKGRFYLVHIPSRIDEVFVYAYQHDFAVKKIQFIHSKIEKQPIIVLMELVKQGKFGTKVEPPICIDGRTTYQNMFRR